MSDLIDLGTRALSKEIFRLDVEIVLRSNLLVQANSGGGKSWLLRRIIEQTHAKTQQIVIDPEGEFHTLREKLDVLLIGEGGDAPVDVRSARLLAHRLLELGASAVIDLYEVSPLARPCWLAEFCEALIAAPKKLWRDLLLYVDEAHTLAPEPGHGAPDNDALRRSRAALIEVGSRGRKRGYGLVAATQRLGKLSKDVAAELKNVLVGQTFIDIDRERAAGCLGIARTDRDEFYREVKNLRPGRFFALGRALCLESTLVEVGKVLTTHPEPGRQRGAPPPPTDKIRHLLPQLADLPRRAEEEATTMEGLRARVAELERELARRPKAEPAVVEVVPKALLEGVAGVRDFMCRMGEVLADVSKKVALAGEDLAEESGRLSELTRPAPVPRAISGPLVAKKVAAGEILAKYGSPPPGEPGPTRGHVKILAAAAQYRDGVTRAQLTVLCGYKRSSRDTYLQRLRAAGFVEDRSGAIVVTAQGRQYLVDCGVDAETLPTGRALYLHWISRLPEGERKILEAVAKAYPEAIGRDAIDEATGYRRSSRDTYLQRLRARALVEDGGGGGTVRASPLLFG